MFSVLLVDDEQLSIVALQHMLPWQEFGFTKIITTTSSEEALRILREQKIDACFVDVNMPKISGLDLLKISKEDGLLTRFVVVSGYSDFSYAQQAISYDVVGYCLKPIVTEKLIPAMERLVKKIQEIRQKHDSQLFSAILSDNSACGKLISHIKEKSPDCEELSVMLLRGDKLLEKMRKIPEATSGTALFLKQNELLLIWSDENKARQTKAFLSENRLHDLMVCGMCECKASMVRKLCVNMFRAFSAQGHGYGEVVVVSNTNEQVEALAQKVVVYVEENYEKNISLQDIADEYNVNYSYLSRVLNKYLGCSFAEYLTTIRLKKACQLLTRTYLQITDVSKAVGFTDYHYFSKIFKKFYNMTPSQYRESVKKD